ncbi:hypothetical protein ACGF07_31795 [Kitasatospora sp. NPDC048194]|uniref:hypothetical protein n=1 Tax=Kitasatospora sp. NPDC048194 TaxID=3364045 RepID=UPI00371FFEDB
MCASKQRHTFTHPAITAEVWDKVAKAKSGEVRLSAGGQALTGTVVDGRDPKAKQAKGGAGKGTAPTAFKSGPAPAAAPARRPAGSGGVVAAFGAVTAAFNAVSSVANAASAGAGAVSSVAGTAGQGLGIVREGVAVARDGVKGRIERGRDERRHTEANAARAHQAATKAADHQAAAATRADQLAAAQAAREDRFRREQAVRDDRAARAQSGRNYRLTQEALKTQRAAHRAASTGRPKRVKAKTDAPAVDLSDYS